MPDVTTTPAAAAHAPVVISFDSLLTSGLMIGGRRADKVRVHIPGVGWTVATLPMSGPAEGETGESDAAAEFTAIQVRVINLFQSRPADVTLKGTQISALLSIPSATLRKHLSALMKQGVLDNSRENEGYRRGEEFPDRFDGNNRMTKFQSKILRRLSEFTAPVTRKQLARACGRDSTTGSFGVAIRELIARSLIHERNGVLTHDPAKFDAASDTPGSDAHGDSD